MQIGPYVLPNAIFVAPMAGVTDRPFRQLCRQFGAGYAVSEMVTSRKDLWKSLKTSRRANHDGEPGPIAVQIAGTDAPMMAEAAAYNIDQGAQIIDINMGCPAKKVCNKWAGSALMQNEKLAIEIAQAVVAACAPRGVPVTLKMRTGWCATEKNALNYFKQDVLNTLPGKFAEMEIKEGGTLDIRSLIKKIDTTYGTTIVLGLLDPDMTYQYLKILSPYAKRFGLKVYCMPTSEAIKAFSKTDEFLGMPIYHTTSYIVDKITPASMYINRQYKKLMGSAPADIVYKGFESLYFFAHLMKKYGVPFNEKIGDNSYTFLTPYKIVTVKEKGVARFYENKFLYIIRYEDGIMNYE